MSAARLVSIQQPSYLPWLGHFEMMLHTGCFLFFDDVQYTKRDWRNRNRIRAGEEASFLTVPVRNAHNPLPLIMDTLILENGWRDKHLRTLRHSYARARHFDATWPLVEEVFATPTDNLGEFNIATTQRIADWLGIECRFERTSRLGIPLDLERTERVALLCEAVKADTLYNGQTAKLLGLIDRETFQAHGLGLEFQVFEPVPYPQLGQDFIPRLSVLDALFCIGAEATLARIQAGHSEPEVAWAAG